MNRAPRRALHRAGALALAVTACGLSYDPHAYAAEPKRALALACACVVLATAITHDRKSPTIYGKSWTLRAVLAFLCLSALSLAWGRASGALDLATWISGAAFGMAAYRLRPVDAESAARLAGTWLGGGVAIVTLVSALLGARGFALQAGQGNPNWLGLLLAVTLPLALDACILHVRARELGTVRGVGAGVLSFVQLPALYLAHSRVAWVGAAAAILALVFCIFGAGKSGRAKSIARAAAMAVPLAIALFFSHDVHADDRDAFSDDVPAAHSLSGRTFIWKVSAVAARDALPFGCGLGQFDRAYHDAQARALATLEPGAASRTYENATTAHQEYLQTAIESGPFAALAILGALVFGVMANVRKNFGGGAGALVSCAVLCLGDSPLRQPAVVLVVALVLGASAPLRDSSTRDEKRVPGSAQTTKLVLAVMLLATAWCLVASTRAWLGTRAYLASFEADPDARRALLGKSIRLDPSAGEPRLERGLLLLSAGDANAARLDFEEASTRMADPNVLIAKGHAELDLQKIADAERSYRAALGWNPGSLLARVGLAETLRRQGRFDEAEDAAKIAHKISPGHPRVRDLLDAIHEGKADELGQSPE